MSDDGSNGIGSAIVPEGAAEIVTSPKKHQKLFALKAAGKSKDDTCRARGCKNQAVGEFPGELWREFPVRLCDGCAEKAVLFAEENPNYEPPQIWSAQERSDLQRMELAGQQVGIMMREGMDGAQIARGFEIEDQKDLELVNQWLLWVVERRKEIESFKDSLIGPLNLVISRIRALLGPAEQTWADFEVLVRHKLSRHALLEAERTEAAMAAAAAAAAAGDETGAALATSKITNVSELEGTSVSFVWDVEIEDVEKVPSKYIMPKRADISALKIYARECQKLKQIPTIPGVKFVKNARTIVRPPRQES